MIGGSVSPKRGELSSLTARIIVGSSDTFVDAYMMTLHEPGGKTYTADFLRKLSTDLFR